MVEVIDETSPIYLIVVNEPRKLQVLRAPTMDEDGTVADGTPLRFTVKEKDPEQPGEELLLDVRMRLEFSSEGGTRVTMFEVSN